MRKTILYIALLTLILSACTSPRREAMRQRLQYVSACNRADTLFTARWLPTVDSLVSYFDPSSRSWTERLFSLPFREGAGVGSNERMMAHYLQGRVHHDMGEAPQALECYQKAAEQADTTRDDCDLYTLYAVYGQMATLFHAQFLPDEEMQALKVAEKIAWKDKDTLNALYTFNLRKKPYYLRKDTDSILAIEQESRRLFLSCGINDMAARTVRVPISILLDRGQSKEIPTLMKLFEGSSGLFDSAHNIRKGYEIYYYDKGRYSLATQHFDSARIYFEKTLQAGYKEAGYKGLLSLYEEKAYADSISKYAILFAQANDSTYKKVDQAKIHQISAMYDYGRMELLAEQNALRAETNAKTALVFFILIVLSLLVIFSLVHVVKKKRRERQAMKGIIDECRKEIERLEKEKETLHLLNVRQDNAKTADLENLRNLLESKEKRISSLQSRISYYQKRLNPELVLKTVESWEDTDIYQSLRAYLKDVTHHPTNTEWEKLCSCVETVLPNFKPILAHEGNLSDLEYRVCCLIRMGFTPSETAVLTGFSNISVLRKRLHKKILKQSGSPKEFDKFIMSIGE